MGHGAVVRTRTVLLGVVGGHQADVGQIAIALRIIHSIADDEQVWNGETDIIGVDLLDAARRLVEQRGDAQGFGLLLQKDLAQVGEGQAGVEDVFDDQDVLALDRLVEVLDELDGARGALAFAVAGDGDKVKGGVDLEAAGQVGQEEGGALQYATITTFSPFRSRVISAPISATRSAICWRV